MCLWFYLLCIHFFRNGEKSHNLSFCLSETWKNKNNKLLKKTFLVYIVLSGKDWGVLPCAWSLVHIKSHKTPTIQNNNLYWPKNSFKIWQFTNVYTCEISHSAMTQERCWTQQITTKATSCVWPISFLKVLPLSCHVPPDFLSVCRMFVLFFPVILPLHSLSPGVRPLLVHHLHSSAPATTPDQPDVDPSPI